MAISTMAPNQLSHRLLWSSGLINFLAWASQGMIIVNPHVLCMQTSALEFIKAWFIFLWYFYYNRWQKLSSCTANVPSFKCHFTKVGLWRYVCPTNFSYLIVLLSMIGHFMALCVYRPFFGCFLFAAVAELLDNAVDEVNFKSSIALYYCFGFPLVPECEPSGVAYDLKDNIVQ